MSTCNKVVSGCTALLLWLGIATGAWSESLENDAFVSGEMDGPGEVGQYTFDASAGDLIYLTVADRDQTTIAPGFRLLDPSGTEVANASDNFTAKLFGFEVQVSGEYQIVVRNDSAFGQGTYHMHFARVPGANEKGLLTNDEHVTASQRVGDIDTFTFVAAESERIHLNVVDGSTTSGYFPSVLLIGPDSEIGTSAEGNAIASIQDFEIGSSGTWTILIVSRGATASGNYELRFTKVPGSNEKGTLPNDSRLSGKTARGDIDSWIIDMEAGEHLYQTFHSSEFYGGETFLYDPDGELLATGPIDDSYEFNGLRTDKTGQHTLVISDSSSPNPRDYVLHTAVAPGGIEGGTLTDGMSLSGQLDRGDIDTFEFGASAGAEVVLSVSLANIPSFQPEIFVHAEDGTVVANAADTGALTLPFDVNASGFYSVVLKDLRSNGVGAYSLDYSYRGDEPPVRPRDIDLEPDVWHLFGVPAGSFGTVADLFSGPLDLASYDNPATVDYWVTYTYEPDTFDQASGQFGVYRKLALSEPVPQGTGFWLIHLGDAAVQIDLPIGAVDAPGSALPGCAVDFLCVDTPLATVPTGGWTIGSVPSVLNPGVESIRILTSDPTLECSAGCTLTEASEIGYAAPGGTWVFEPQTGSYRLRTGTDSIAPWQGFWMRVNAPAVSGSPTLLLPVQVQ